MSHTSAEGVDARFNVMLNMRAGVRDKIRWMPEKFKWDVKFKGEIGDDLTYCKEKNITLEIANNLNSEPFMAAREEAFLNAVEVWNAIDKSGRQRIVTPERRLNLQMIPVPKCDEVIDEAMSHTESEHESEHCDGDK